MKNSEVLVIDEVKVTDLLADINDRNNNGMITMMEVIMSRDQRTTGHRVIKRRNNSINNIVNIDGIDGIMNSMIIDNYSLKLIDNKLCENYFDIEHFHLIHHCDSFNNVRYNCKKKINRHFNSISSSSSSSISGSSKKIISNRRISSSSRSSSGISGICNSMRSNIATWLRLGSFCLALLLVMSAQSAPTAPSTELQHRRMNSTQKWVNPCGMATDDFETGLDVVQMPDERLLSLIVLQAKTALEHAQLFCNSFVKHTFDVEMKDVHKMWRNSHYDWLPNQKAIPKQLGEHLPRDYLDKLNVKELDKILLDIYQYLQLYAVGLEQIVWDQDDNRLGSAKNFSDAEFKLRTRGEFVWSSKYDSMTMVEEWNVDLVNNCYRTWYAVLQVLCEVQVALMERGVQPRVDVTRAVMSNEYRSLGLSTTYRNVRDWLIFRDYMNGLEYIIEVFDHIRQKLPS